MKKNRMIVMGLFVMVVIVSVFVFIKHRNSDNEPKWNVYEVFFLPSINAEDAQITMHLEGIISRGEILEIKNIFFQESANPEVNSFEGEKVFDDWIFDSHGNTKLWGDFFRNGDIYIHLNYIHPEKCEKLKSKVRILSKKISIKSGKWCKLRFASQDNLDFGIKEIELTKSAWPWNKYYCQKFIRKISDNKSSKELSLLMERDSAITLSFSLSKPNKGLEYSILREYQYRPSSNIFDSDVSNEYRYRHHDIGPIGPSMGLPTTDIDLLDTLQKKPPKKR